MKRLVTAREQAELAGFWHTATDDDWYRQAVRIASLQADQDYYLPASDDWEDPATKGPQTLYRGLVVPSPVDLEGLVRSVGRSWTSDEDRSAFFSDPQEYEGIPGIDAHGYRGGEGPFVGVNLEADWNGDLDSVDYNWRRIHPDEDEVRLKPGTPISVRNMHYVYPDYGWDYNNVLADGPRTFHADWYRQAARIAAQAAELEWRHSLDGGPEWELIANPPTGQTQVIQTEDSRHQHYGVRNARVFSGGDDPIADQKEYWRTQVMLPGMNRIPHTPGPFTGPPHSVPQGEDPEAAAFGLSHPQPSLPGMEVVQPADDVVRDLKRTPSEGAAPYGDRLERALYDEFMEWWPTSTAYATRTNDEGGPDQWVTTNWMHHPDEPITHWMNVEDFLKERYPEAATNSHYGIEDANQVMNYLDRPEHEQPTPEELKSIGYTSLGNAYTQAMLNLHNKLQGRNWASDNDRDRYMRLMLKHVGPSAPRLARLLTAMRRYAHRTAMPMADAYDPTAPVGMPGPGERTATTALEELDDLNNEDRRRADDDIANFHAKRHQDTSPYGQLQNHLYDQFMSWWPTSQAAQERDPQTASTNWYHYPDEPITHWLNVEDFLKESYPQSATGAQLGVEQAHNAIRQNLDPNYMHPHEWDKSGLTGTGDHITQAMLSLHNRIQGRTWESPEDERRYYDLMLKHLGPQKAARLARLAASSFSCPPGQPGCVSAMGNPLKVEMPESKAPTAADYAEPWDANQTPADYSNSSYYIDRSGVGYPSSGGGTGGGGSWGGGGGSPDADNILPSSRALYDQLMQDYPGADIGGYRVDSYGEHARGALDFMTSDPAQAAEIRQKAFDAGAPYVLWQQRQWNADGTSSPMENRGDPTQNHYDHVHIAPIGG